MKTRITRRLTDVIKEVKIILQADHGIGPDQIEAYRNRIESNGHSYPNGTHLIPIKRLSIDYEVQRDVIVKHIISIMKRYDKRLCTPVSACCILRHPTIDSDTIFTYDGQHRSISTAILGYDEIPCHIVETDDPAFPSYAFEESNETGVKKLVPADIHRNALTRFKLGSREIKNVIARKLQDQFDKALVDLEDKTTRKSAQCGDNEYFFSHFKYAQKSINLDSTGKLTLDILTAISTVFPKQEEIDQGLFIGLYELARLDKLSELPDGWMISVLQAVKHNFKSSYIVHSKAKNQFAYINPGASWSAPQAMSNFLRELYLIKETSLILPYHGAGAQMQLTTNPAPNLFHIV